MTPKSLTTHTATELKNKIGQITREVCKQGQHVLIERGGLPIMVIVPMQDYQQLLEKQRLPEQSANELPPHERQRFAQQLNGMDAESLFSLPPELHPYLDLPDYAAYRANRAEQQRRDRLSGVMDDEYLLPETALLLFGQMLTEAGLEEAINHFLPLIEARLASYAGGGLTREQFLTDVAAVLNPDAWMNFLSDGVFSDALRARLGEDLMGSLEPILSDLAGALGIENLEEYLARNNPESVEGLDAESVARQGLLLGMENDEQLKVAYELLEGWDDETSLGQLAALQGSIDKVRTEMAGLPLPAMRQVYQKYYEKRLAKHQAMLELRRWVFKQEGPNRVIAIDYLSQFEKQLPREQQQAPELQLPPDWRELTFPDLIKLLETTARAYAVENAYTEGNDIWLSNDALAFVDGWDYDGMADLNKMLGLSLIGLSFLFEPLDWGITGFSIMRDIATGRVGWGTAFDLGSMLLPGSWSWADDAVDAGRAGMRAEDGIVDFTNMRPLNSLSDPFQDILGPAMGSAEYGAEVEAMIRHMKEEGVEILFRDGGLAYMPAISAKYGPQLHMQVKASIGAWRHEYRHFLDHLASGLYPGGLEILMQSDLRWKRELDAYMAEIDLARKLSLDEVEKQLIENMRREKDKLLGTENGNPEITTAEIEQEIENYGRQ